MTIDWESRLPSRPLEFGLIGLSFAVLSGCGSRLEIAPVSGTVLQAGEPLEGVMVTFMPDPQRRTNGAISTAITDRNGEYELTFRGADGTKGAVVGHHRVVVKDVALENSRDESIRPRNRVPQRYRLASQTPLTYEIATPTQAIDIEIPPP